MQYNIPEPSLGLKLKIADKISTTVNLRALIKISRFLQLKKNKNNLE